MFNIVSNMSSIVRRYAGVMPTKRAYADHGDACATAHAMELLGDRWTYPILRELMLSPKRFTDLITGARGVTPAVLTARLRELETSGLIERVTLPAPTHAMAYRITPWGLELQPIFQALGRWAQASPVWQTQGCGLTPDAAVQSMLTMAPSTGLTTPTTLELRLHDKRQPRGQSFPYCLQWNSTLTIEGGPATEAAATVAGDSSTWTRVLYDGAPLAQMQVTGDVEAVRRVVAQFAATPAGP